MAAWEAFWLTGWSGARANRPVRPARQNLFRPRPLPDRPDFLLAGYDAPAHASGTTRSSGSASAVAIRTSGVTGVAGASGSAFAGPGRLVTRARMRRTLVPQARPSAVAARTATSAGSALTSGAARGVRYENDQPLRDLMELEVVLGVPLVGLL